MHDVNVRVYCHISPHRPLPPPPVYPVTPHTQAIGLGSRIEGEGGYCCDG
jgi:hypothetical protein